MVWIGIVFGIYCAICFALAQMYLHPPRIEEVTGEHDRPITIGKTPAWAIDANDPKAVFVFVHGYGGSRQTWEELAFKLSQRGYTSIIPSMPAHGENPDPDVGFGLKESKIAAECAAYAREHHPGLPVIGVGISLGGAAVWLASENFDAVATEGTFPTMNQATDAFLDSALPWGHITFRPVKWIAEWRSGIPSNGIRPIDRIKKWKDKPVLVMHGTDDRLFPIELGEEIAKALGTDLWRIKGASHAYGFDVAGQAYIDKLDQLAKDCGKVSVPLRADGRLMLP